MRLKYIQSFRLLLQQVCLKLSIKNVLYEV